MLTVGLSKIGYVCGICKKKIPISSLVYHDASKATGNNIAHKKCFDDLRSARETQLKLGRKILSKEELDPPF